MNIQNKVFKTKGEALSNAIALGLIDFFLIPDRDNVGQFVYRIETALNVFQTEHDYQEYF